MSTNPKSPDDIRESVREGYARRIKATSSGGACCGGAGTVSAAQEIGYSEEDISSVPDGVANSSFGCGNPLALASIQPGETVVDLGSGAGLDCLLAAQRVGPEGRVIGLDMTPEMIERARANVAKAGLANVEFRQGTMEEMPIEDNTVDLIISNCVINLSPDKETVFREIARVLRPGGRVMVSDIVLTTTLPESIRENRDLWGNCLSGAMLEDDYLNAMSSAGLEEIKIESRETHTEKMVQEYLTCETGCCSSETPANISTVERAALSGQVHSVKVSARNPR